MFINHAGARAVIRRALFVALQVEIIALEEASTSSGRSLDNRRSLTHLAEIGELAKLGAPAREQTGRRAAVVAN